MIADNSNLVVDINYHFPLGSKILMGANAKLTISNGANLQVLDQAQIIGCQAMWDRVDVQDGSLTVSGVDFSVNGKGVFIADGINGIVGNAGTNISVDRATFLNNRVGIFVPQSSLAIACSNSRFEVNSFKSPLTGQAALAGIRVNNMSKSLVLDKNYYTRLPFGVWATNSSMVVTKDKYENISDAGILTESIGFNTLVQSGLGQSTPSFISCFTGIRAVNVAATIKDNLMTNVNRGISMSGGTYKKVWIENNTINASRLGIAVSSWTSYTSGGFRIEGNTINLDGNPQDAAGIWLENLATLRSSRVYNNTINLDDGRYGIYCNTLLGTLLADNIINMNQAHKMDGINLENVFQNDVYCNGTNGTGNYPEHDGIRVATSSNVVLNCNVSDNTGRAIHYDGQNLPIRMISNFFNHHNWAVQYEPGTLVGVQSHHGNRWLSILNNPVYGVWHKGNQFEIGGCKIQFDAADEPVPGQTQLRSSEEPTQQATIFEPLPGNTLSCVTSTCPPSLEGHLVDTGNEADALVAGGNYTPSGLYPNAQAWVAKRQLYRRLLAAPSLLASSLAYQNFYNANANTTVGKLGQVEAAMDAINALDASTQSGLEAVQAAVDAKVADLAIVEAQLANNPTQQQQASLEAQRQSLLDDILDLQAEQEGSLQTALSVRQSAANQWLPTNNTIQAMEEYEQMQQQVNAIALGNIANGVTELTTSQRNVLTPIANTCPYRGGQAVYQARALLADQAVYDDASLCAQPSPLRKPKSMGATGLEFKLYPNPANGYTIVELADKATTNGFVLLTDALGKNVLTQKFEEGDSTIPVFLDELPSGLYQLTIKSGNLTSSQLLSNLK